MPANKNQRIRCLILDKCFRNTSKKYQIQDLVDEVNDKLGEILPDGGVVSRRTIYNDIEFMKTPEGGLAEIKKDKDGVKVFYQYEDPSFSIVGNPFNEAERKYLRTLVETLSNFRGLPQLETLMESISNIELMTLDKESAPCMEFEENPYTDGLRHLQYILSAIQSQSALLLVYEPFGKEKHSYRFHPQYLKQYNHRWYVFGATSEFPEMISNFPLDRIVSIEPIDDKYIQSTIDWSEYFDDVIGITVPEAEVEEVHFIVHGRTGFYIQSNPLHASQRSNWIDEQHLDVRLSVRINYELQKTLMSYADSITIVSPEHLKTELLLRLQEACKRI